MLVVACTTKVRVNESRTVVQAAHVAASQPLDTWHRHIALAIFALAFLTAVAAGAKPDRSTDPNRHAHYRRRLTSHSDT